MWDRSPVWPAWSVICIRTCARDIQQQQQLDLNYLGSAPRLLVMQRCGLVSSCGPVSALKQVAWSSLENTQAHTLPPWSLFCSMGRGRADFEVVLALATQVVAHRSVCRQACAMHRCVTRVHASHPPCPGHMASKACYTRAVPVWWGIDPCCTTYTLLAVCIVCCTALSTMLQTCSALHIALPVDRPVCNVH